MFKTLKGKISIVYLCLVLLIAVVGTASVISLYMLSKSIDGLMTNNYKSINAISNMIEAIERQDSAILIYINGDHQKGIDLYQQNGNEFLQWYDIEQNNITELNENQYVQSINDNYTKFSKLFYELQEISNTQGPEKATDFYSNEITQIFTSLKKELKELSLMNEKAMFNSKIKATNNAEKSVYFILILSAAAALGGVIVSNYFTNRFLKPMHSLTQRIKSVKAGELNQQISIISNDEIGELTSEFNHMTERLQQYEQSTLGEIMAERNKTMAIVKSISDPLIVLDNNYRIILLNDACESFFNIEEKNVYNKHFLEAIMNGKVFEHISSIYETKSNLHEDFIEKIIPIISGGKEYYFNIIVTVIRGINSETYGLIVLFQNVTELKKAEKIKADFMATISHEFKTPLTSILMGTSLINDCKLGNLNEKQREIIEMIREDSEKVSELVNDLLELSKLESGKSVFKMQPCSITEIIKDSIKPLYTLADQKHISLCYDETEGLPLINADREKMAWVVNNLTSNALKFTREGDSINIKSYFKDDKIIVCVNDTGVGIPEEYREKVFEKFFQVPGYDLEVRGTGLGLSIVKEIVKAHGGEIWCDSKIDLGSTFTFTIPAIRRR